VALIAVVGEPKSRRVYLVLRDGILNGTLAHDARLPNENELARAHGVSRVTIRRALAVLETERLIERRPSRGTRVIHRPNSTPIVADIAGVLANLTEMGRRTDVKLLAFDYVVAGAHVSRSLKLNATATVQRAVRVRSVDRVPFSYLTTYVPEAVGRSFTKAELATRPMLELLERSGVKVERAAQRISAVLAAPVVAKALGVRSGSPLIEVVRVVFDRNGKGVEYLQALYRPDRYNLQIDLMRSGRLERRNWKPAPRAARGNGKSNGQSVVN
jgi:GntR family transcriptional regulator